jgi:hypothetical protein
MNNFLALGAFVACGWVASNVVPLEPAARPVASRSTTIAAPATASKPIGGRDAIEARRAPVPLVRNTRAPILASTSIDALIASADALTASAEQSAQDEQKTQDDLDRKAAKAAVEADGYKRPALVGKASNGSWRAKAYRGTTEVWLTVDGTGRVSLD